MLGYQGYESLERNMESRTETKVKCQAMFEGLGSGAQMGTVSPLHGLSMRCETSSLIRREGLEQTALKITELVLKVGKDNNRRER